MNPFLFALLFSTLLSLGDYLLKGSVEPLYTILYFLLAQQQNKWIVTPLVVLTLFEQLFYTYFARPWHYSDLYNFFTHTTETFETFFAFLPLFWKPFLLFLAAMLLLHYTPNTPKSKKHYANTIFLVLVSLFTLPPFQPFIEMAYPLSNSDTFTTDTPRYPARHPQTDIILLIGESMNDDNYIIQKLQHLKPDFFTQIISGAINTDVSVPLLLNAKTNPLHLSSNNQTNLFRLAKANGFDTAFISAQSEKSLRYIKPYLQTDQIDFYKSFDKHALPPNYDMKLLETLTRLPNTDKPRFIVLQQIGEHSPYIYYPGKKSDTPQANYRKSIDYSFMFYQKLIDYLNRHGKPYILLYTSDHGEFTGERGRWGHNSFAPTIYQVPFFATANIPLPETITHIKTHHDLSRMLVYLLGYGDIPDLNTSRAIVNGTMLSREDGYREIAVQ